MDNRIWSSQDKYYMHRVLTLAARGRGRTSPNPSVGAALVANGRIIAEDYHHRAGEPHAEALALSAAGSSAAGATLYVNLEPCVHQGHTPPCVEAIIKAKVNRVVVAMIDPNPQVNGKGLERLRNAGIEVELGLLEDKARRLNEAFIKYITTGRPFVILKIALSLDGKIATKTGESKYVANPETKETKYITSEPSLRHVHKLRNEVDATLVGIGTLMRDNSRLTTRLGHGKKRDAIRIIVDSLLKVPLRANIFTEKSNAKNIIVTTASAFFDRIKEIEATGSQVLIARSRERNKVDLTHMMEELGKQGITSVMIEGGAEINASAIEEGIVDKALFFIAPKIIGGKTASCPIGGSGVARLQDAIKLKNITVRHFGEDIMLEGYIEKPPVCAFSTGGCATPQT